jgi:putative copper resistance protein D
VPGLTVDPLSDTHAGGAIMWVGGDGLMVVVMIALTLGFLRRPDVMLRDRTSWVEQVRQTVFAENVGASSGPVDPEFDEADANRERYNQWLASLHESSEGKPQR